MRFALTVLLLVLAGCSGAPQQKGSPCLSQSGANELPSIELQCFSGGTVQMRQLPGPMVINLWASWCEPCAKELPALQRLADRNTIAVIGVATDDTRDAAASRAEALGVHMPLLLDRDAQLRKAIGEANLPVTLFVDAQGKVSRYVGPALTDEKIAELIHDRLGVA